MTKHNGLINLIKTCIAKFGRNGCNMTYVFERFNHFKEREVKAAIETLISEKVFLYEYGTLESQLIHTLKTPYSERETSYKRKLQQAIKGAFMSELKAKRERELSIAIWVMEIDKIGNNGK